MTVPSRQTCKRKRVVRRISGGYMTLHVCPDDTKKHHWNEGKAEKTLFHGIDDTTVSPPSIGDQNLNLLLTHYHLTEALGSLAIPVI